MSKYSRFFTSVAAASLLLAGCSSTTSPPTPSASESSSTPVSSINKSQAMPPAAVATIDKAAKDALKENPDNTPGLWVAVWDPKVGYYEQAYGDAIAETTKATTADHNWIGSITKTVFATAVLQQVAAGTLTLSDTVATLDPDLATKYPTIADITVGELLGMVSGIPDYADAVVAKLVVDQTLTFTRDDLIEIGLAAGKQEPVGELAYSTTNYIILGNVLATVTGKSPEDLVNAVFAQAGMTQSMLPVEATALPEPASHGYMGTVEASAFKELNSDITASTDVTDWSFDYGKEGGGAYSIIGDLATWGGTCLGQSLLPADMAQARLKTHTSDSLGEYGLGMRVLDNGWIGHDGQVLGWNADVECNTETGAVLALMSNSSSGLITASYEIKTAAFPED